MDNAIIHLSKADMLKTLQYWLDAEFKHPQSAADVVYDATSSRFKVYLAGPPAEEIKTKK